MAQIVINEISQNYTYNIGSNSFATVALPITAMWGPAYMDPESTIPNEALDEGQSKYDLMLEETQWLHFPATQEGLESFVATYRGPASCYKQVGDYSYQMAMTLLTAGYDVLVCRVCPGTAAYNYRTVTHSGKSWRFYVYAKYPGTFGNNLQYAIHKLQTGFGANAKPYWNMIVYLVDASGVRTAVENLIFVFDVNNATDNIPHVSAVESKFIRIDTDAASDEISESEFYTIGNRFVLLDSGKDDFTTIGNTQASEAALAKAVQLATMRYTGTYLGSTNVGAGYTGECPYITAINSIADSATIKNDYVRAQVQQYKEWVYSAAYIVYNLLKDKLNYNPQRIISPGWDDQDLCSLLRDSTAKNLTQISPLHKKIMDAAYYSRCATGMIDVPKSLKRSAVHNESSDTPGYIQRLARVLESPTIEVITDINGSLYTSHSAFFAPWGQYTYVGMAKQCDAPPALLALLMQRAMILNQSLQYEWALPTNRKHRLRIGKMAYKVPKKLLDAWQKLDGVSVNVLTEIPELGMSVWGNSTLFEVPPATYQALANLSTRYLVNAVEDVAYKCGLAITFQYNNEQAYNKFYAGVTPTLDTMKNVGAIDDYYVKMAADINGLDQVNANTVIGKIYLVINGVINDIIIDLIALPPGTDLNQYKS